MLTATLAMVGDLFLSSLQKHTKRQIPVDGLEGNSDEGWVCAILDRGDGCFAFG
jgi:hypothetical protein